LTTHQADRLSFLLYDFNRYPEAVPTTAAPKHVMPYLAHNEVDYKPIGKTPATLVPDSGDRSDGSEKIRELATLLVNTSAL